MRPQDAARDDVEDGDTASPPTEAVEALEAQLGSLALAPPPRRLVVLDLNGLLLYRVFQHRPPPVWLPAHQATATGVGQFWAWRRPHVVEFLDWLLDAFDVGVWSSAANHNTGPLVDWVMGPARRTRLQFEWDQSRCHKVEPHPDPTETKPLFLKVLQVGLQRRRVHCFYADGCSQKVWDAHPAYNATNTLLIDDTPLKARDNPPNLLFSPTEWLPTVAGDVALAQGGAIAAWLAGLAQHPGTVADYVQLRAVAQ